MATTPIAAFISLPSPQTHHRLTLSSPLRFRRLSHNLLLKATFSSDGGDGSYGGGGGGGGGGSGGEGGQKKEGYWVWVPGRNPEPDIFLTTGDVTFRFKDYDSYNRYADDYIKTTLRIVAIPVVPCGVINFIMYLNELDKRDKEKEVPGIKEDPNK